MGSIQGSVRAAAAERRGWTMLAVGAFVSIAIWAYAFTPTEAGGGALSAHGGSTRADDDRRNHGRHDGCASVGSWVRHYLRGNKWRVRVDGPRRYALANMALPHGWGREGERNVFLWC